MGARKIATSVPAAQYEALERVRRRLRLKRSEVIQQALAQWLADRENDRCIAQYIRGYQEHPDDPAEAMALMQTSTTGMTDEKW